MKEKNKGLLLLALASSAMLCLAGCDSALQEVAPLAENESGFSLGSATNLGGVEEGQDLQYFATGVWASEENAYTFYQDATGGSRLNRQTGAETVFSYHLDGENGTFDFGGEGTVTNATVTIDGDKATVAWSDGTTEQLTFYGDINPSALLETAESSSAVEEQLFTPGVWVNKDFIYDFANTDQHGNRVNRDSSVGDAFTYTVDGDNVTFYFGSNQTKKNCTVKIDGNQAALTWSNGSQETLTYEDGKTIDDFLHEIAE